MAAIDGAGIRGHFRLCRCGWPTAETALMKNRFTMSRTGEMVIEWRRLRYLGSADIAHQNDVAVEVATNHQQAFSVPRPVEVKDPFGRKVGQPLGLSSC